MKLALVILFILQACSAYAIENIEKGTVTLGNEKQIRYSFNTESDAYYVNIEDLFENANLKSFDFQLNEQICSFWKPIIESMPEKYNNAVSALSTYNDKKYSYQIKLKILGPTRTKEINDAVNADLKKKGLLVDQVSNGNDITNLFFDPSFVFLKSSNTGMKKNDLANDLQSKTSVEFEKNNDGSVYLILKLNEIYEWSACDFFNQQLNLKLNYSFTSKYAYTLKPRKKYDELYKIWSSFSGTELNSKALTSVSTKMTLREMKWASAGARLASVINDEIFKPREFFGYLSSMVNQDDVSVRKNFKDEVYPIYIKNNSVFKEISMNNFKGELSI